MSFISWLRNLKANIQDTRRGRTYRKTRRNGRTQVRLEQLEDRVTPATYGWDALANTLLITLDTNESLTVSELGGGVDFTLSSGTFTQAGPSLAAGNATTIEINAADLATSVTINNMMNSQAINGTNNVTFSGSGSLSSGMIDVDLTNPEAVGTIAFTGGFDISATTAIDLTTVRNISADIGSIISTSGNGDISLSANQQTPATSGNFVGIYLSGGTIQTTDSGEVALAGRGGSSGSQNYGVLVSSGLITSGGGAVEVNGQGGGDSGSGIQNYGVRVVNSGTITSGDDGTVSVTGAGGSGGGNSIHGVVVDYSGTITSGGAGTVSLLGTGGSGNGSSNSGVWISQGTVTSGGGAVEVTGHGAGTGTSSTAFGVVLADGVISAGGIGTVTVQGSGGGGSNGSNHGVWAFSNSSQITSSGGAVQVTGQGGGSGTSGSDMGVFLESGGVIAAGGTGAVTVTGTGGGGSSGNNYGVVVGGSDSKITSSGTANAGNVSVTGTAGAGPSSFGIGLFNDSVIATTLSGYITLTADSMDIQSGGTGIDAQTRTVTLKPKTAAGSIAINLGSADSAGTLGLTDAELDQISAGTLNIGDASSGTITVSAAIQHAGDTDINVTTGRNILFNAGWTTANGDLSFSANQQAVPTSGNFVGIDVYNVAVQSTGTGAVALYGKGGDDESGSQNGVMVRGGSGKVQGGNIGIAVIIQGTGGSSSGRYNHGLAVFNGTITSEGSGTLSVEGTGGSGTGSQNCGVYVAGPGSRITSEGGAVEVTGQGGGGSEYENLGVLVESTGMITAGGAGTVSVSGTGGAGSDGGNWGVSVVGTGSMITSGGGAVEVTGQGGSGHSNYGVYVLNAGTITSGSGATVTVEGIGGNSENSANHGVVVSDTNSKITSGGGAVHVTGTGNGFSHGVDVLLGGLITAAGSGTVTVEGTGGMSTGSSNYGVLVLEATITSSGGNVEVIGQGGGTGGGGLNHGVAVVSNYSSQISAGGTGTVTVQGTGGGGVGSSGNHGVLIVGSGASIFSGSGIQVTGTEGAGNGRALILIALGSIVTDGGNVTLIGDSMRFDTGVGSEATVYASSGTVTLQPRSNGVAIELGTAIDVSGGPLALSDAELNRITAGTLIIGDSASGNLTVNAAITRSGSTDIELHSGGAILFNPGSLDTAGGNLLLAPGTGGVQPITSGTDVSADTVSFASDLTIAIGGTDVDTEYSQFNVSGTVDLDGVDLVLAGIYDPDYGDTFTIVSATSVTNQFNGLEDGDEVTFNGVQLTIDYTPTAVTLTAIDNIPPSAPHVALFDDTGSSALDGITSDGSLELSGVEDDASVEYSTNGGATWLSSFTAVSGLNFVQVLQFDAAGNASDASAVLTFTLDTAAPSVAIDSPVSAGAVGDVITITGTSSDPGSGVASVYVRISRSADSNILAEGFATNTGTGFSTWSFTYTPAEAGAQYVNATAADIANNTAGSSPVNFSISPASTTIQSVTVGAQIGSATYGTGTSVTYAVDVVTSTAGLNPPTVELYIPGGLPADLSYQFAASTLSSGGGSTTLTVFTSATDAAVSAFAFTVKADSGTSELTESGTLTIAKADANFNITPYSGTYDGAAHGLTGSVSGVEAVPADLNSLLHLGATFTNAPGGTATWNFDGNGNYNSSTGTAQVAIGKANANFNVTPYSGTYDGDPHGLTGTASGVESTPADLSNLLDLGATFTDAPGGTANWIFDGDTNYYSYTSTGQVSIGKVLLTVTADPGQGKSPGDFDPLFTYQFTSGSLVGDDGFLGELSREPGEVVGSYAILQGALTLNGNYALTYVGDYLVISDTTAPAVPGVALFDDTGSSDADRITKDGSLALSGIEEGASAQYTTNGGAIWRSSFTTVNGGNFVQVRQIDAAGNASEASAGFVFTLDVISPTIWGVAVSDSLITHADEGATFTVRVVFSESMDTDIAPTIAFSKDIFGTLSFVSGAWSGSDTANDTYIASYTIVDAAVTVFDVEVSASGAHDVAGNIDPPASNVFDIDTKNPQVPGVALFDDTGSSDSDRITKEGSLQLSGIEVGASVEYSTNGGTNWASIFAAGEGSNTVKVRQIDAAGNAGEASATFTFTLDTAGPSVAVVPIPASVVGNAITITGTSSDAGSGVASVYVRILRGSDSNILAEGFATNTGTGFSTWSFTYTPTETGTQHLVATATDRADNSSNSGNVNLTIGNPGPQTTVTSLTVGSQNSAVIYGTKKSVDYNVRAATTSSGTNPPGVRLSVSGLPTGVTAEFLISSSLPNSGGMRILRLTTTSASAAGSFPFTISATVGTTVMNQVGTLSINKKALTVAVDSIPGTSTANAHTKAYGTVNPAFSVRFSGFVTGQTSSVLTGSLAFNTLATTSGNVGTYAVNVSGLSSNNYLITYVSGSLAITTRQITVTAAANVKVADGLTSAASMPAITWGGPGPAIVVGDTANFSERYSTPTAGINKQLVPSGHVIAQNGGNNYSINFVTRNLGTITAGAPVKLAFAQQPEIVRNGLVSPPPIVQVTDNFGNSVRQAGIRVTMTLHPRIGSPVRFNAASKITVNTDNNGRATFSLLKLSAFFQQREYYLRADFAGATSPAISDYFKTYPRPSE